ncbi:MAG: Hsp20/alpha crystallin family protein [Gammaproteobacteria bacterium]
MAQRITSPFGSVFLYPEQHRSPFDQFFGPAHPTVEHEAESLAPPVDIYENDEAYSVMMDIPGAKKEGIHVSFSDGTLAVNADVPRQEKAGGRWVRHERRAGQYVRSLQLSESVDGKNISATYRDGILELTIPKPKRPEAQRVDIKVG